MPDKTISNYIIDNMGAFFNIFKELFRILCGMPISVIGNGIVRMPVVKW